MLSIFSFFSLPIIIASGNGIHTQIEMAALHICEDVLPWAGRSQEHGDSSPALPELSGRILSSHSGGSVLRTGVGRQSAESRRPCQESWVSVLPEQTPRFSGSFLLILQQVENS